MSNSSGHMKTMSPENENRALVVASIEEQFKALRPSSELMKFYRNKLAFYEKEFSRMAEKVNVCKRTCDEDSKVRNELRRRSDEVFELQKALSDVQVYLLHERKQAVTLLSVNELQKIQIAKDNKKINLLLSFCDITNDQLDILLNEGKTEWMKKTKTMQDKFDLILPVAEGRNEVYNRNSDILLQKIFDLEKELKDLTNSSHDEIYILHKDREVLLTEREKEYQRMQDQISVLAKRLSVANSNICELTNELITLKKIFVKKEENVILGKEKERQMNHLCRSMAQELEESDHKSKTPRESVLKSLKDQLQYKENLIKSYKEQCKTLENELWALDSSRESSVTMLQKRLQKMNDQLVYISGQYQKLQKKRNFEIEGVKSDLKILKEKFHALERKSAFSKACTHQRKELMANARETHHMAKLLEKELVKIDDQVKKIKFMD